MASIISRPQCVNAYIAALALDIVFYMIMPVTTMFLDESLKLHKQP